MKDYYIEKENSLAKEQGIEFFAQKKDTHGYMAYAHLHPSVEILYFIDGSYEIYVDGKTAEAYPGDMAVFRSNTVHSVKMITGPGEYRVLKISPEMILRIFAGASQMKFSLPFLKKNRSGKFLYTKECLPDEVSGILIKMIEESVCSDEILYISERILASSLLLAIIRNIPDFTVSDSKDGCISSNTLIHMFELLTYINENCSKELSATSCACFIHVSYSYFAKLFINVTGKTYKEYLTAVRLAKAQELLAGTDMPVTDIALACGYNSLSYFIAEYKKSFGKSPNRARKSVTE